MTVLRNYIKSYKIERSDNVDDSDRTHSILDEYEPDTIFAFLTTESPPFHGNVWGDIYRNKFFLDVRNPPEQLTPDGANEVNPCIDIEKLK